MVEAWIGSSSYFRVDSLAGRAFGGLTLKSSVVPDESSLEKTQYMQLCSHFKPLQLCFFNLSGQIPAI